jgi:methenyltetrahydrofolate cyclohydrolase
MGFSDEEVKVFAASLASGDPVPGGGGASALVGALGVALGSMVGNLTVGKARYAAVQDEVASLMAEAEKVRAELLALIDADAAAFVPLSQAYGIPKDDPTRAATLETALVEACTVPLQIMQTVGHAIELLARLGEVGSVMVLSDVGVGALCCRAALEGASLNVFVNTKLMTDRNTAAVLDGRADAFIARYAPLAEKTDNRVIRYLRERG